MPSSPTLVIPGSALHDQRRILLITYDFAPSWRIGARRWIETARLLSDLGWGLDVVCSDASGHEDPELIHRLPPGVRVFSLHHREGLAERVCAGAVRIRHRMRKRRRSGDGNGIGGRAEAPTSMARRRSDLPLLFQEPRDAVRAFLGWLDHARFEPWVADATAMARSIIGPHHRVVISSGPPHMAHEAGRRVAERTGLPLFVDFRDAWSTLPALSEPIASVVWYRMAAAYEARVVKSASLVLTTTDEVTRHMQSRYPAARDRIATVMNGADPQALPEPGPRSRFIIGYAGSLYLDRDPRPLFLAVRRAVDRLGVEPERFGVEMIGGVDRALGRSTRELAEEAGVERFVSIGGRKNRSQTTRFLMDASVLVVLAWSFKDAVPAKLFDYLRYPASILVFSAEDAAPARVFGGTAVHVVPPHDIERAADLLCQRYRDWEAGRVPVSALEPRFERRAQIGPLVDALDALPGARSGTRRTGSADAERVLNSLVH
ncbi:MAG: hypothetical protein R3E98_02245 [Gemmatimonadota bacterium]